MSLTEISIIGIVIFLVLMFLGMHIGLSMALAGLIGLWMVRGFAPAVWITGISPFTNSMVYYLSVVPIFVWMGLLASYGGISKDAFASLNKWLGHLPGGLAMATMAACAAFGAVCGSSTATAATMVTVALPQMRKYGYNDELSTGSIAAGGNLGFIIPPSSAFIVYGFVTQVSIGSLFIAGILPGLLMTALFCITIYIMCLVKPSLAPRGDKASLKERISSIKGLWGIILIFIIVMGGIYAGVFTPTEAASVGAFVALILGLVNRQLTWKKLLNSLFETMKSSAMIFLLIAGAMIFGSFLTASEVTITVGSMIAAWNLNPYIILTMFLIFFIVCGFFMDIFALIIISLPIAYPIVVTSLGFDPVLFGVLCVVTIMMGCISPPVGVVVFAVHGIVPDVPLSKIFRGVSPFLAAMCILVILLVAFPEISLILPRLMLPYN